MNLEEKCKSGSVEACEILRHMDTSWTLIIAALIVVGAVVLIEVVPWLVRIVRGY